MTTAPKDTRTLHLSHTGYYAGHLMCGAPRTADTRSGHVPYSHLDTFFALPELCPQCVAVWRADDDDTTEHQP